MKSLETYSPHNNISIMGYDGGRCRVQISNSVLKEEADFETDTDVEAHLVADRVLKYYADKEIDYTYHPCSDVSTRAGSFWRFDVVGTDYCDGEAINRVGELKTGEMLLLVRERNNEYDPKAIRVLTADGMTIGYVPARRCREVGSKMGKVGLCWVEVNGCKYGDAVTVIFSFDKCRLEQFASEELSKPRFRARIDGDNPFHGKAFDVQGRFKLFPSQGEVHRVMEDFGAVAYWNAQNGKRPEVIVLGSSSPADTLAIVERQKAENPSLEVVRETELVKLMEQYQPGWSAKLAKPKAVKKEQPKGVGTARAYISKTLKKVENGAAPEAFRQSLQERVDLILAANEPLGDSLRQRLRSFGVSC